MPDGERTRRKERLFHEVTVLAPGDRERFLREQCPDDPSLAEEILELLSFDTPTEMLPVRPLVRGPDPREDPEIIGPYRILERIGEGGFGVVFLAEQLEPIHRRVAIKVLKLGWDLDAVLGRFESERQVLAILDHPNIAKVFDAGATEEGIPYFVMEHVVGLSIDEYFARRESSIRERLDLFLSVCRAVQHAHQKGIIHRDLKPHNVLVSEVDGAPLAKVIDFGIAKATSGSPAGREIVTREGQLIGTPRYMSPEQARGRAEEIDSRTDVYSLGVILYELLVGEPPHDWESASTTGALRIAAEQPIRRPSTLNRRIRGDLETILLKALEQEPERRYPSAAALADDIERYLSNLPIQARPPGTLYQIRKLAARHPAAASSFALVICFAVAFGVVMAVQSGRIAAERNRAEEQAKRAQVTLDFLTGMIQSAEPGKEGRDVKVVDLLDRAVAEAKALPAEEPETRATVQSYLAETYYTLGRYEDAAELYASALQAIGNSEGLGPDWAPSCESSLSQALLHLGRLDEAEHAARSALDRSRRRLGAESEVTLVAENNLANVLMSQDKLAEAEDLLRHNLETKQRVLGKSDPSTLTAMGNLAALLDQQGKTAQAEQTTRRLLEILESTEGPDQPIVLITRNNLAAFLRKQGKLDEAESVYRSLLERQREVLGPGHPSTLRSMGGLVKTLILAGDYAEAETLGTEYLDLCVESLDPGHPRIALARKLMIDLYEKTGRSDQAEAIRQTMDAP